MARFRDGDVEEPDPEDRWKHKTIEQIDQDLKRINNVGHGSFGAATMILIVLMIVLFCVFLFCSCGSDTEKKQRRSVGVSQYVFVDIKGCLHTDAGNTNRHKFDYDVLIDTVDLSEADFDCYCSMCVSQKEYLHLQRILARNKRR